jgi:plastocyanin
MRRTKWTAPILIGLGLVVVASPPVPAQSEGAEVARLRAEVTRLQQEVREQRQLIMQLTQMDQQCHDTLGRLITPGASAAPAASGATPRSTMPPLPRPAPPPPEANETATVSGRVQSAGEIGEAYVYLDGFRTPPVKRTLEIRQRDKRFIPSVEVVQVGTRVLFPNYDTVIHNVFSSSPGNSFDLGTVKGGDNPSPVVLLKPGPVEIFCNIHARMRADLLVVTNPHWTKVAPDGTFQLAGVPVGSRKVALWGPTLAPASQRVEVTGRGASVTLTASPAVARPHLNKQGQPYGSYAD